jgi:tRNA 2-thiocytidine biosynthesis protein TtcA
MPLTQEEMRDLPLFRRLRHAVGRAVADFAMIREGDRIAVGVSGGKDSYTLLLVLEELRRRAPIDFQLVAVTIDSGYPGFRGDIIRDYVTSLGIPCHLETTTHYEIITEKRRPGSSYCSICARLKRGALYGLADSLGCNKLALGHHGDDFIETLLLNQFFVGSLKAMSANMLADNGRTTVIRPLVYASEEDIVDFMGQVGLPVVSCSCPVSDSTDLKRRRMKELLRELEQEIPHVRSSMLKALSNVHPRHLLDQRLQGLWSP